MSRVIISSNCKISGHNLARFHNSLKNSFGMWDTFFLWDELFFLEFSENNKKSGEDYISQVGICFTCGMNCSILPIFYRILWKNAKNRVKDWIWQVRMYSTDGWILRFYPVFPELTLQTENRGEDWLWKARVYPTCGINCQISPYLSLINGKKMES